MLLVVYFDNFRNDLIKRLREFNIEFEFARYDNINLDKTYDKVIITGSKKRILRENNFPLLEKLLLKNTKVIGICFGFQYLAFMSGGKLAEGRKFVGMRDTMYFNHFDRIIKLPDSWTIVSKIEDFINIAGTDSWVGFQFHPEKSRANFVHYLLPFL
jgi:GMP synthase (glutamine-hydrolysing)